MKHRETIHLPAGRHGDSRYPSASPRASTIHDRGFTLIEFLVVLSIIVFLVPSLFGLMFALLRQQSRIIALQEVKRQGDLVYNHMKVSIKNSAASAYSDFGTTQICVTSPTSVDNLGSMYFLDAASLNTYFGYKLNGTWLEYERTSAGVTALTNSSVTVSNLEMGCTKNSEFAPPLVNVSFTVTQPSNNISLNYKTLIKLNPH